MYPDDTFDLDAIKGQFTFGGVDESLLDGPLTWHSPGTCLTLLLTAYLVLMCIQMYQARRFRCTGVS